MQSPNVSDAKVLKILARKERREQQASPAINLADILSSVSVRKYGSSQAAVGDQNSSAVAQEKANYLSKIKEENEVLKDLLHEVQLNKEELVKRMKELEQARDAILSLRPRATKEFMDSYLMDTCPLASANRSNVKLSVNQSFQIDEIYDRMLSVSAQFRSNQAELQDFILQRLTLASDHFLGERFDLCSETIQQLENIISANPRNVGAAQDLVQRLEESIFESSAEQFAKIVNEEVARRQRMHGQGGHGTSQHSIDIGGAHESKTSDHYSSAVVEQQQSEIAQLTAQNESLRHTVAELREKIAKMKVGGSATAATATASSLYGAQKKSSLNSSLGNSTGGNGDAMNKRQASPQHTRRSSGTSKNNGSGNHNESVHMSVDEDDVPGSPPSHHHHQQQPTTPVNQALALGDLESDASLLAQQSPWILTYLSGKIEQYAAQIIESHPLAAPLVPEALALVTQTVASEVAENSGLVLFVGLLKQAQHQLQHPTLERFLAGEVEEEEWLALGSSSAEDTASQGNASTIPSPNSTTSTSAAAMSQVLSETTSQLLRLVAIHNDVVCYATLFLGYMRSRCEITAPIVVAPVTTTTPSAFSGLNLRPAVPTKILPSKAPSSVAYNTTAGVPTSASLRARNNSIHSVNSAHGRDVPQQIFVASEEAAASAIPLQGRSTTPTSSSLPPSTTFREVGGGTSRSPRAATVGGRSRSQSGSTAGGSALDKGGFVGGGTLDGVANSSADASHNAPYLYRSRSDSGDELGGFPRRRSPPRDNVPRYMMPKSKSSRGASATLPTGTAQEATAEVAARPAQSSSRR